MASDKQNSRWLSWVKRIGFWGFIFFLVKGLVWLAVGYWFLK
jgi:hypothetical protein